MKILITGAAGFLGSHLCERLLNEGHTVVGMDNFITGSPENLAHLANNQNFSFIRHDVANFIFVPGKIDAVMHFASPASPNPASPYGYTNLPIQTMKAGALGTHNTLGVARAQNARYLLASTSEIYGDPPPDQIPTREDYRGNVSCTGPRACYDESKRYGETLCVTFYRQFGLPIKVARPFNNYGPGLKLTDRRVIPDFACDILAGRDILMHSDGSPTRTFCYTADAIVGYYKILVRGRLGEAYNIGTESPEICVLELAQRMIEQGRKLFGYRGRLIRQSSLDRDYLVDNPTRRCPNINKARRDLNYEPSISLEEGLRRSLIWYDHNRQAEDA